MTKLLGFWARCLHLALLEDLPFRPVLLQSVPHNTLRSLDGSRALRGQQKLQLFLGLEMWSVLCLSSSTNEYLAIYFVQTFVLMLCLELGKPNDLT